MAKRKKNPKKTKSKKKHKKTLLRIPSNKYSLLLCLLIVLFTGNFIFQVFNKPTEFLSLAFGNQAKTPQVTWESYQHSFRKFSTKQLSPYYLAALAQNESSGDPFASPPWQLTLTGSISRIFAPASSSVGLYQFTQGTFDLAKNYCIKDNEVSGSSQWFHPTGCWFNWSYLRFSPSDSIELASAYLTKSILDLEAHKIASRKNIKRLASVIHLCGVNAGKRFLRSGFKLSSRRLCGSHSVRNYVLRVEKLERRFRQIAKNL